MCFCSRKYGAGLNGGTIEYRGKTKADIQFLTQFKCYYSFMLYDYESI